MTEVINEYLTGKQRRSKSDVKPERSAEHEIVLLQNGVLTLYEEVQEAEMAFGVWRNCAKS
jgi:hypothetical protein